MHHFFGWQWVESFAYIALAVGKKTFTYILAKESSFYLYLCPYQRSSTFLPPHLTEENNICTRMLLTSPTKVWNNNDCERSKKRISSGFLLLLLFCHVQCLEESFFEACSRSEYCRRCFAHYQECFPCPNFYLPGLFTFTYFKILSQFSILPSTGQDKNR